MLGAQARAAELQAAKSAAMRQKAHRDADDQALPPESAPVSLTDFVRNPLLNRNKGTKAYRPLATSDLETPSIQVDSKSSTPGMVTAAEINDGHGILSGAVPSAPRAMLARSDQSTLKIRPRIEAATFTPRSQPPEKEDMFADMYDTGVVSASPCIDTTKNAYGYVFGPDDLSPIKQQIKFAEMRQQYSMEPSVQTSIHHFPTPFLHEAGGYTPQQSYSYENSALYPDIHTQLSYDSYLNSRPPIQHYHSETGTSTTGLFPIQGHAERIQSFTDDLIDHHHKLQHQFRGRTLKPSLAVYDNDRFYDRNSKLQNFVAAQQAMAKKGKTVLHNPDLYRSPQKACQTTPESHMSTLITPSPLQTHPSVLKSNLNEGAAVSDISKERDLVFSKSPSKNVVKSHGLQSSESTSDLNTAQNDHFNGPKIFEGRILQPWPNECLIDEWAILGPITIGEREKMLRARKRIKRQSSGLISHDLLATSNSILGRNAQTWLKDASTGPSTRRLAVTKIVDEYERRMETSATYGVIGKPIAKEKSSLATRGGLRAVANIMATLYDSTDENRKSPARQEYGMPQERRADR